jgi:hypothetical protein
MVQGSMTVSDTKFHCKCGIKISDLQEYIRQKGAAGFEKEYFLKLSGWWECWPRLRQGPRPAQRRLRSRILEEELCDVVYTRVRCESVWDRFREVDPRQGVASR